VLKLSKNVVKWI